MKVLFNSMYNITINDSSEIVLTFITDIHISGIPPGRRQDDYLKSILDKVNFAADITKKYKAIGLCGGDVFHTKNYKSRANSLNVISDSIKAFSNFPSGGIYGIVGNHDISEDNLETLSKQPLGVLIAADVYRSISNKSLHLNVNDGDIGSFSVEVVGFDYKDSEGTMEAIKAYYETNGPKRSNEYRVALIHQMGHPGKSKDFFGEKTIGYDDLKKYDFDIVLWGHDHSRIEPTMSGETLHLHYGSLSRASLASDEVDRDVVIPLITFSRDHVKYKEIKVPTTPLAVAFELTEKKVKDESKDKDVKDFFADIDDKLSESSSEDPVEILKEVCEEKDIINIIMEHCEL